ncbi:hypothetical protein SAMN04487895_101668 [Paenibacillus sophorae]|uniref:Uncharacterized protein n=1 Tax=Paenibacillus sophorae TaxID=1333845 RepID=A0A1H8GXU0_9BACL|nr:hypothetical protein [Paenibacillus sophorae]QWU14363.1 hypothetical protein KP014_20875 [Paenibacillus sophorae]SEN48307.1 hypothetical protein SAMN04487895_101668 [Paenibacillus sophorae]
MLIDIEFKQYLIDECNERLKEHYSDEEYRKYSVKGTDELCHRIAKGIYYTGLNFNHYIELFSEDKIIERWDSFSIIRKTEDGNIDWDYFNKCSDEGVESKGNYGVCDDYQQVLDQYPELEIDDRKFVLGLSKTTKRNQSSSGGWRWEKWGEYIGKQNSQADYLYDEPEIEEIYCYHIYEIA